MEPIGNVAERIRGKSISARKSTAYRRNQLMHLRESINAKQLVYFHRPGLTDPRQIISDQVDHHYILRPFLGTGLQLLTPVVHRRPGQQFAGSGTLDRLAQ